MFINPRLYIAFPLAAVLFFAGLSFAARIKRLPFKISLAAIFLLLSLPGFSFTLNYIHLLGNSPFYYEFRSWESVELLSVLPALFFGFLAGELLAFTKKRLLVISLTVLPAFLLVFMPFCKPLLLSVTAGGELRDIWLEGNVCMQTSSTCGPASLATLMRIYGVKNTEKEIAKECYSSLTGTESWYLARYARRNGFTVSFVKTDDISGVFPDSSILGVNYGKYGHFIALMGRSNGLYRIGDPLCGLRQLDEAGFKKLYSFSGFAMEIRKKNNP